MPPNPYVEILTAMMAVLGGRNLGGLLSHEGGILITGISAPVGRHMRVPMSVCLSVSLFSIKRDTMKRQLSANQEEDSH